MINQKHYKYERLLKMNNTMLFCSGLFIFLHLQSEVNCMDAYKNADKKNYITESTAEDINQRISDMRQKTNKEIDNVYSEIRKSKNNNGRSCLENTKDCCSIMQSLICIFILGFLAYTVVFMVKTAQEEGVGICNIKFNDFL